MAVLFGVVAAACGSSPKGVAPAADRVADGVATTTTAMPQDAGAVAAPTPTLVTASSTTIPPATTTTLVAIEERPRTTAPATEEDPVPVGELIELIGIWDIVVTDVDLDATADVLAYVDINPLPEPGFQYVMVTVAGLYLGERTAQPAFEWWISDGDEVFQPWIPGCGVVPDSIYDIFEVSPGESFVANLCLPVPTSSIEGGLTLTLQPQGAEPFFFDLAEGA